MLASVSWASGPVGAPHHAAQHLFPASRSSLSFTHLALWPDQTLEQTQSSHFSGVSLPLLPYLRVPFPLPPDQTEHLLILQGPAQSPSSVTVVSVASPNPIISSLKGLRELCSPAPVRGCSPGSRCPLPSSLCHRTHLSRRLATPPGSAQLESPSLMKPKSASWTLHAWAWRSYGHHLITSPFVVPRHVTRGTTQLRFPSRFCLHGAPLFHWLLFFSLFADFSFPLISKCQGDPGLSPQPSVCIHSSVITSRLMALNTTQALTTHTFYLQPKLLLGTLASFTQQPG